MKGTVSRKPASLREADAEITALLERMGLATPGEEIHFEALTGGVSSEIWLVQRPTGPIVLKRARERLRVEAEWHAPIDRGAAESAWLSYAGQVVPGSVPHVLATDAKSFAIALEYLDPASFINWKTKLLTGSVDVGFAAVVGRTMGKIHAASARTPSLAEGFANQDLFELLRIEPYLRRTATAVPEVAAAVETIIRGLQTDRICLIHGDFSPKNILVGEDADGPRAVILDAECATWGDPAFDAAFCLSHLLIKQVHLPKSADRLREASRAFERAYLDQVDWEVASATQQHIDRILPALVLARVVGASPVEYLNAVERSMLAQLATVSLQDGSSIWAALDEETGTY